MQTGLSRVVDLHVRDRRLVRIDRERRRSRRAPPSVHELLSLRRHGEASCRRVEGCAARERHVTVRRVDAWLDSLASLREAVWTRDDHGHAASAPDPSSQALGPSACSAAADRCSCSAAVRSASVRAELIGRGQCVRWTRGTEAVVSSRFEALPDDALVLIFELVADADSRVHYGTVYRNFAARVASSKLPTLSRRLREPAERGLYAHVLLRHEIAWPEVARQLVVRPERARYIRHLDIQTTGCAREEAYRGMADVIEKARLGLRSIVLDVHYTDSARYLTFVTPRLVDMPALRHLGLKTLPEDEDGLPRSASRVVAILDAVLERLNSLEIMLGCFHGESLETRVKDVPRLRARPRSLDRLRIHGSWLQLVADLTRPPCPLRVFDLWDYRTRASTQKVLDAVHPATAARIQHMPSWNGLDASRFSALELDGRGGLHLKASVVPAAAVIERSVTPAAPIQPMPTAGVPVVAAPSIAVTSAAPRRAPRRKAAAPVPMDGPASRTRSRTAAANGTVMARASSGARAAARALASSKGATGSRKRRSAR